MFPRKKFCTTTINTTSIGKLHNIVIYQIKCWWIGEFLISTLIEHLIISPNFSSLQLRNHPQIISEQEVYLQMYKHTGNIHIHIWKSVFEVLKFSLHTEILLGTVKSSCALSSKRMNKVYRPKRTQKYGF